MSCVLPSNNSPTVHDSGRPSRVRVPGGKAHQSEERSGWRGVVREQGAVTCVTGTSSCAEMFVVMICAGGGEAGAALVRVEVVGLEFIA